ncbi:MULTISPECIES: low-specificity L-threonine aldolase [Deefgea]|uniref:Low-specificity L-threonine aldolase n=1 Tax=Deefgea chitinilytica TaxID=570276 RepID=A0ABS2C9V1_9NEIS|nr:MULTISPECIES: low-specificity L-threonine aldolase [Deefgea]MBM5570263.1 low-specificity L-threonine aldolase [Deefgea chitinilytica]MBM9887492.1 low-specificity L-threonine aldolase [Deefgea sp. CFH1-16]
MDKILDLRSDTVTHPTPAMRAAMANAIVGDDCYADDPTVIELEQQAASKLGKAAALFVPTGTLGNQLAIFTHCQPGNEVIVGDDSHIVYHEVGAAAAISGVQLRTLDSDHGTLDAAKISRKIRHGFDIHEPKTGLICIENAHSNGRVIPLATMQAIWQVAQAENVPVHLDGARVFNAAAHLNVDVREITQYCDSLMFCLSKGLAAPIGSMLLGSEAFIAKARKKRKLLGGGLRQAGVLAAPGLIALNDMPQRLIEDHQNAQALAVQLAAIEGIEIDLSAVHINMVWLRFTREIDVDFLMQTLAQAHIKANPPEHGWMRLVTHWQITSADLSTIVSALKTALS